MELISLVSLALNLALVAWHLVRHSESIDANAQALRELTECLAQKRK